MTLTPQTRAMRVALASHVLPQMHDVRRHVHGECDDERGYGGEGDDDPELALDREIGEPT